MTERNHRPLNLETVLNACSAEALQNGSCEILFRLSASVSKSLYDRAIENRDGEKDDFVAVVSQYLRETEFGGIPLASVVEIVVRESEIVPGEKSYFLERREDG